MGTDARFDVANGACGTYRGAVARLVGTRLRQDPPQRAKGCGEASHRVSVAAAYIFGGGLLLFQMSRAICHVSAGCR